MLNIKLMGVENQIKAAMSGTEKQVNIHTIDKESIDLKRYYNKTQVDELLDKKVDKIEGKELSTNDYTDEDKQLVHNLDIELDNLTTNMNAINSEVNKNIQDITELKGKTNTLQSEIIDQEETLNHLANTKQDTLIAGDNITIVDNVISSTGSGGVSDYNELTNKPKINGVELVNNKTSEELGLASKESIEELSNNKVDKEYGKGLSTNDFTNDDKDKLSGLQNYDDTELKKEIKEEFDENNERFGLKTTRETHIEDSIDEDIQPTLYGYTKQETISGKNLITNQSQDVVEKNGLTFTKQKDGSVIVNGTSTALTWYGMKPKSDYEDGNYYLYVKTTDDNLQFYMDHPIGINASVSKIVTLNSYNQHDTTLRITSGVTLNNARIYFMLAKSNVEIPYEPAIGITPRPDYPQPIEVLTGDVEVISTGENLYVNNKDVHTFTASGDAWRYIDGSIGADYSDSSKTIYKAKVEKDKTYTFIATIKASASVSTALMYDNNSAVSTSKGTNVIYNNTFTSKKDAYVLLRIYVNSGISVEVSNVMLKEGTVVTEYQSYQESKLTYHLGDNFVASIGDVKDELIGNKLIKRIGKVVLDGSESWQVTSRSNGYQFQTSNSLGKIIPNTEIGMLSNYFKGIKFSDRDSINESIYAYNADTDIRILTNVESTTANFKTWLSQNPVEVYYILAEPYEVEVDVEGELRTYNPVTNITTPSEIEYTYKNRIDLSQFVVDKNYVHTDNNYTSAEKQKVANALTEIPTASDTVIGGIKSGHHFRAGNNPYVDTLSYESYKNADNGSFMSKGTVENVITGKQLTNVTDLEELEATLKDYNNLKNIPQIKTLNSVDDEVIIDIKGIKKLQELGIAPFRLLDMSAYTDANPLILVDNIIDGTYMTINDGYIKTSTENLKLVKNSILIKFDTSLTIFTDSGNYWYTYSADGYEGGYSITYSEVEGMLSSFINRKSIVANNVATITLNNNFWYQKNISTGLTKLNQRIPVTLDTYYEAKVSLNTSSTSFTNTIQNSSNYKLKFVGLDCVNGEWNPRTNMRYNLDYYFDGVYIVCNVTGFERS